MIRTSEEGIACWFEHAGDASADTFGTHTLVLSDHNAAFADAGRVRYHRADATEAEDSCPESILAKHRRICPPRRARGS